MIKTNNLLFLFLSFFVSLSVFAANAEKEITPPKHFVKRGQNVLPQEAQARKATGLFLYNFLQQLNTNNEMPSDGAHIIIAPTWEWVQGAGYR